MRLWVRGCAPESVGNARKMWCSPLASMLPDEHSSLHSQVARVGSLLSECGCIHAKLACVTRSTAHAPQRGSLCGCQSDLPSKSMASCGRPCRHACYSRRPPFVMPSLAPSVMPSLAPSVVPSLAPYQAAASAPASPHAPLSGTATPHYTAQPPPPGSHAAHAARSRASSPRASEHARAQAPPAAGADDATASTCAPGSRSAAPRRSSTGSGSGGPGWRWSDPGSTPAAGAQTSEAAGVAAKGSQGTGAHSAGPRPTAASDAPTLGPGSAAALPLGPAEGAKAGYLAARREARARGALARALDAALTALRCAPQPAALAPAALAAVLAACRRCVPGPVVHQARWRVYTCLRLSMLAMRNAAAGRWADRCR